MRGERKSETVKIAGREFALRSRDEYPEAYQRLGETSGIPTVGSLLTPHHSPDDHKDFPGQAPLEGTAWFVRSGVTDADFEIDGVPWYMPEGVTKVEFEDGREPATPSEGVPYEGFSARNLRVFTHFDWYMECMSVLEAHGWPDQETEVSPMLMARLVDRLGDDRIAEAKVKHGSSWYIALFEVAAGYFAPPLSRLWYAANMMALYYVHQDDLRLGYLWAEYRIKMKYELLAIRKAEQIEKNQDNGNGLPPEIGAICNVSGADEEDACRRRDTALKRSSRSCGRST